MIEEKKMKDICNRGKDNGPIQNIYQHIICQNLSISKVIDYVNYLVPGS